MASYSETPKKGNHHRCSSTGCGRNKAQNPSLHYYRFPVKRPQICEQWLINCANEQLIPLPEKKLSKRIVSELHFTDDCFISILKTRLNKYAVPTIPMIDDSPL